MRRLGTLALLVLTGLMVLHLERSLPGLPERLATHFGAGGVPNGWTDHDGLRGFTAFLWLCMVGSFWGLGLVLPKLDPAYINLPNREHWLAPERREASMARIRAWMEAFGAVTLLGMIGLNELVFTANRLPEPRLDEGALFLGMALYLGGLVAWCVGLVRAFPKPPR
jgi:hypothetical protein